MVACLLPDKGSLNNIRRSLMPFGNHVSFLTRSDLMANNNEKFRSFMSKENIHKKEVVPYHGFGY